MPTRLSAWAKSLREAVRVVDASKRFCPPYVSRALLHLLAHQVEPLERRFVRHHEEIGIAAARLVAREGPMRDREHVMLRPFEGLLADARAPLARDHEADHVVGRALRPRRRAAVQARGVAIKRRHYGATGRRVDVADHA